LSTARSSLAESVDFTRDIRPLLSDRCFKCHGPSLQESDLRLDQRADALSALSPGEPSKSELLARIHTEDVAQQMPPPGKAKPLSDDEKAKLRAWIAAGAPYQQHWAYVKPRRSPVPTGVQPIDHFVRTKLAEVEIPPSPPASLETLCRRLHLDVIGLPPSPGDIEQFIESANRDRRAAVEALVDRLLASPRFGEKWARHWLDLARYGDSAGYQHDDVMALWPYRDWVIQAFNADMPFDQFTIEQIAGDLLPKATLEQRIATGFHRGATVTLGADQNVDELRAQLVWDRVNTVGTTWLATSLECAQCHTHKFDPISIADYYAMYAYFNCTVPELTKETGSHYFITGGILELPDEAQRTQRANEIKAEMQSEVEQMLRVKARLDEAPLRRIYRGPAASRMPERLYYYLTEELKGPGPEPIRTHIATLRKLGRELLEMLPPRSLVLEESSTPPITRILLRGNVRTPGEEVRPGVLSALHPLPVDSPPNRLGLAQWLVSPDNPLTARVVINRWWAELFGLGLVTTSEDFGLQGEAPSHPELLDWLALEFMDSGWRMKPVLRQILLSETYQQRSVLTPVLLAKDPQNRLLARGSRHRLEAELLRDNALAIAGLLHYELGGKPAFATPDDAQATESPFSWRRSIYLRQQRGDPYATFITFDAPDRFVCSPKRPSTNTPLQALALLNEPVFFEAARGLARRVDRDLPHAPVAQRLSYMFRVCTARFPSDSERDILGAIFERLKLESAEDGAAWTLLANVMLNLDETLTKE